MNFGQAIDALKTGKCVMRAGWNGKGMFIYLNKGSAPFLKGLRCINGVNCFLFDSAPDDTVIRMPNINTRAADGSTVTGWLASQTDMLAEDWEFLN